MKKLFLSLVAAIVAATATYAQSSVLATLSHDGEISTFYGGGALKDAHAAAVDGDIITLSSGTFVATNNTKNITLRGAGFVADTIVRTYPTVINGDFNIAITNKNSEHRLLVEGIYNSSTITVKDTLRNAAFQKCRLGKVTNSGYEKGIMQNVSFIHCYVTNKFQAYYNYNTVSFVNSYVDVSTLGDRSFPYNNFEFVNCFVEMSYSSQVYYTIFRNCIMLGTSTDSGHFLGSTNQAYNCVCGTKDKSYKLTYGITITANSMNTDFGANSADKIYALFKSYKGSYTEATTFELTDEAKAQYKGDDGTEVGMYGGNMPFSFSTNSPKVTKFIVGQKTTSEGKLSVDFEVTIDE